MPTRTYPPTLEDVKEAVFDFPGLAKTSDTTLQLAMDQAEGEIEANNSWAANPTALSPRMNRTLWALCVELIIMRLRWRVERDPDTNDVPKSLQTMRAELLARITGVTMDTPEEQGRYLTGTFDPLDAPDLPTDNRMW